MALTPASFRQVFPEFADATAYPDARVNFVLNEAALRLLPSVWGELLDTGTAYYVAHKLAIGPVSRAGVGGGQATTAVLAAPGLITARSVGPVSKSMDVNVGSVDGAGDLNLSTYGREFASLAATIAVGAMQF